MGGPMPSRRARYTQSYAGSMAPPHTGSPAPGKLRRKPGPCCKAGLRCLLDAQLEREGEWIGNWR